jgi:parvulin-like peptidyl-prolyl isomerase
MVEEVPPRIPELDKVREKVVLDLKKEKAEARARALADEMYAKMQGANVNLADLAQQYQVTVTDGGDISHYGFIKGLGPSQEMADALFSLKEGQSTPVIKTGRGYCIAVLKKRTELDLKKFAEQENMIREQIIRGKEQQLFQAWLERLKKKNNIIVDYSQVS